MVTKNQKYRGYVGTYTKSKSEGIYTFILDVEKEKIEDVKLASKVDNPTYLQVSSNNQFVYSVVKEGGSGGILACSLQSETGELTQLNKRLLEGAPPCHLDVNNNFIVSGNYHEGTAVSYIVNNDGTLDSILSNIKHEGSGPNKERQEKSHVHFTGFTPDEKFVAVVDLGTDKLVTYKHEDGKLIEVHTLSLNAGSGPRHLSFHPNGKVAYVMTELSSEVVTLSYDSETGEFTEQQYISTIPADFTANNQGSAIHVSLDGKNVYVSNRGHDSIAVFRVLENGELQFVQHISTEGNWPRDFVLDPTESFILCSNQESHNLVLYKRNRDNGTLELLHSNTFVPEPVCVKFLNY